MRLGLDAGVEAGLHVILAAEACCCAELMPGLRAKFPRNPPMPRAAIALGGTMHD